MSQALQNCPLCNAADFKELYVAKDRHYGISGFFRVVCCLKCFLVMLNPMYSDLELAAFYPGDYYAYQDNFQTRKWREFARRILGYHVGTKDPRFEKPGSVLDLGCGSGWFLEGMRRLGWDTYGVEISEQAALLGRKSRGLRIFHGTLKDAKFPSMFFDYVRANHSFEHISRPNETLEEIRRILKPEGKLLIGVPNISGLNARAFKQYWWHLCAPVHAFNYSSGTLGQFLQKHSFQVEKVRYNSDYFGMLGSLQIWLNRKNERKSMHGKLVNNYSLRLVCQCAVNLMDLAGQGDMIEITASKRTAKEGRSL
jgi:SAM-dependent methyltransferase